MIYVRGSQRSVELPNRYKSHQLATPLDDKGSLWLEGFRTLVTSYVDVEYLQQHQNNKGF